jgi:hypothetical protein
MARRWVLTGIVAVALVVAAVFAAHAIRDDDTAAPAPTTPTTGPTTSTTAVPTSTTGAPTTTVAVAGPTTNTATTTTAPAADAPPGPCGADTGPVRAAVDAGVANAEADADVASCRLAPSDPTWAAVRLAAKPGATFTPLTVILHGGAGAWTVVASGGTDAGCGSAPQQVVVDLGQFCAGTGGGT